MHKHELFNHDLTFVIFAFNEENRIARVLKNLIPFAKVLIVDNFSSDKTVEIAKSYGSKVLLNKNNGWVEDEETVLRIWNAVDTNWIYWGFMDEMIELATFGAINQAINSEKYDIINITRKNYFYGRFFYDAFSDRLDRVFKKEAIDFHANKIHHMGKRTVPNERVLRLDKAYFVHHFINSTAKTCAASWNNYSDIEIIEGHRRKGASLALIFIRAIKRMFLNLVVRKGYKAGFAGVYFCIFSIWYDILVEIKMKEYKLNINQSSIENNNNLVRDQIISEMNNRSKDL